jgi:uncharacterized protein (TIGR03643 family)
MVKPLPRLNPEDIAQIIATAWDDKPPFNQVLMRHGLGPGQVVQLLKRELTPSAFKTWTARVRGSAAGPASGRPRAGGRGGKR